MDGADTGSHWSSPFGSCFLREAARGAPPEDTPPEDWRCRRFERSAAPPHPGSTGHTTRLKEATTARRRTATTTLTSSSPVMTRRPEAWSTSRSRRWKVATTPSTSPVDGPEPFSDARLLGWSREQVHPRGPRAASPPRHDRRVGPGARLRPRRSGGPADGDGGEGRTTHARPDERRDPDHRRVARHRFRPI